MNNRKHGFESPVRVEMIGLVPRVIDGRGRDLMRMEGGPQRIVECLNALRHVWYPEAHVTETEAQCTKAQQLRREAWDRVQELEKETV